MYGSYLITPMQADLKEKNYSKNNGVQYCDYFSSMSDEKNGLLKEYGSDGVHPNEAGYKVMEILIEKSIKNVLNLPLDR